MSPTFASLGLPEALSSVLTERNVLEPFPIQAAAIPDALSGRDVSGKAPTGSGKTLAFGLPVLARVGSARPRHPRALILAPTRELADQIGAELTPLARAAKRRVTVVYGGVGYGGQKAALRRGVEVLVATPGRLEDLISQGAIDLGDVDIAVIDEADRMADMGFLPAVRRILDQTNNRRQTLLFSATLDGDIAQLSRAYQIDPVTHEAGTVNSEKVEAEHQFWLVDRDNRLEHTASLISRSGKSIVFTRTRHGADRLARQLHKLGVHAVAMHGGRSQNQRNRSLRAFSKGDAVALVATDVAARGIHVDDVATVIHFDPAQDHKDYVHRSGRTARAGATGTVISMVMSDQRKTVARMQREMGMKVGVDRPGASDAGKAARPPARAESHGPHRLYVGNLPWRTTEDDLQRLFSRHGEVTNATVATHRGRSKGYGIVEMSGTRPADVMSAMAEATLDGRQLKIRPAR